MLMLTLEKWFLFLKSNQILKSVDDDNIKNRFDNLSTFCCMSLCFSWFCLFVVFLSIDGCERVSTDFHF